jgi:heme exporter protein D
VSDHTGFIVAAYAVTAVVLVALVLWVALDARLQKRRLADLDQRGVKRRSERTP